MVYISSMRAVLLIFLYLLPVVDNSRAVLRSMHDRYHKHWHKTFHFVQETERYRNDSLISKETWHEVMIYPDKFRIDMGEPAKGNSYICHKDSFWRFRNGQVTARGTDVNEFVFLLGGMYCYPFDSVTAHFAKLGYSLNKYHSSTWKGKPVYVIGADRDDEKVNQLWIDQKDLYAVRFIKYEDTTKEEGWFDDHIKLGGGWVETKVSFYINGQLRQVEKYHDCTANEVIDERVFDPRLFGKYYWYK